MGALLERASDLTRAASRLALPASQIPMREVGALLRRMNSYYTNRLEGEHTRPSEIERAMQQDYSQNRDLARRQRLAVAHIRSEMACDALLDEPGDPALVVSSLYQPIAVSWVHRELFADLEEADLKLADGSLLQPGELRQRQVAVGRHEAPLFSAIPVFLDR